MNAELNSIVEQTKTLKSEKEKLIGEVLILKEVQELEVGKDFFGRKKNFINLPYDKYMRMKRTCEKLGLFERIKQNLKFIKNNNRKC